MTCVVLSHSVVSNSVAPWTAAHQAPLFMRILQARILEWVDFPFSRVSSQPKDRTQVFNIAGGFFTIWATREAQEYWSGWPIPSPVHLPDPGIEPGLLHCRWILYQLPGKLSCDRNCHNSENWPQGNRNRPTVELKINCTWNNQDDADQTTDDQFQDDCQSWLCRFCI